MAQPPNRKTGTRRARGRESKRLQRDRKILSFLRLKVEEAEEAHRALGTPIEPLSVFYGKPNVPAHWDLTPFPIENQPNGKPMPHWVDLSQWMKVMMAIMLGHQWDILTFNIHLHRDLEASLTNPEKVLEQLAERVRKRLATAVGKGREFFFVVEGFSKHTKSQTFLHLHGAVAAYDRTEEVVLEEAIARAAGHYIKGRPKVPRAVDTDWFTIVQAGYADYLFKFARRFDPRLAQRRLVMSHSMTSAARDLWFDITRPHLRPS